MDWMICCGFNEGIFRKDGLFSWTQLKHDLTELLSRLVGRMLSLTSWCILLTSLVKSYFNMLRIVIVWIFYNHSSSDLLAAIYTMLQNWRTGSIVDVWSILDVTASTRWLALNNKDNLYSNLSYCLLICWVMPRLLSTTTTKQPVYMTVIGSHPV